MVHAVAHILTPILILAICRDCFAKKKFKLTYVMLAGLGGILPDLDVIAYWALNLLFGTPLGEVHRTVTHTLLIPAIAIAAALIAYRLSKKTFWGIIALAFGYSTHLILDYAFSGTIMPFYPLSAARYGLNIIPQTEMGSTILLGIDAIMLTAWLIYDFSKHNIKDFI